MDKPSSPSNRNESAICAQRRVPDWPICGHVALRNFDVLPDVRFGVDDTHVRLVCATIDENAVVHLQKRILGIVLVKNVSRF